jgi:hypothetical protein
VAAAHTSPWGGRPFAWEQCDYDDGNGLWITQRETPCDLGFLVCICPQM